MLSPASTVRPSLEGLESLARDACVGLAALLVRGVKSGTVVLGRLGCTVWKVERAPQEAESSQVGTQKRERLRGQGLL